MKNGKGYAQGNPGLGFTVSISGLNSGGINRIGPNKVDPKGHWVLQQLMNITFWDLRQGEKSPYTGYIETFEDPTKPYDIIRNDNRSGGWMDHAGPNYKNPAGQVLIYDHSYWNFLIKAHNGNRNCTVYFHAEMIFSHGNFDVVWGPGQYKGNQ